MPPQKMPVAVVTGANRGLGFEVSKQLAEQGYEVILTARDIQAATSSARELQDDGLEHVVPRQLDVTNAGHIADLGSWLARQRKDIAVLVNNAGVAFERFDAVTAEQTLRINFFGPMRVTDGLGLVLANGARVVMVSSGMGELSCLAPAIQGRLIDPDLERERLIEWMHRFVRDVRSGSHSTRGWPSSAYRVSKAGLNMLTRLIAKELEGRGIMVNAVCPGWVQTDMGGPEAPRSVQEGAAGIVWAATLPPGGPTGGFFRDGHRLSW